LLIAEVSDHSQNGKHNNDNDDPFHFLSSMIKVSSAFNLLSIGQAVANADAGGVAGGQY
jgi:hypothetical protein